MQNKVVLVLVILLVLAGGYFFISNSNNATQQTTTDTMSQDDSTMMVEEDKMKDEGVEGMAGADDSDAMKADDKVTDETSMMKEADVTFEVGGGGFYFDPAELTVTEGDTVKIVFTNEGGMHDWVIDEFDARTPILKETGETAEITFVADQAGTFEYYCSVGNHRAQGMVGTLTVEPKL